MRIVQVVFQGYFGFRWMIYRLCTWSDCLLWRCWFVCFWKLSFVETKRGGCEAVIEARIELLFEMYLNGCIVLLVTVVAIQAKTIADKSLQILQQHLCREECNKKVCLTIVVGGVFVWQWDKYSKSFRFFSRPIYGFRWGKSAFLATKLSKSTKPISIIRLALGGQLNIRSVRKIHPFRKGRIPKSTQKCYLRKIKRKMKY